MLLVSCIEVRLHALYLQLASIYFALLLALRISIVVAVST
jgi:hypothetical protein